MNYAEVETAAARKALEIFGAFHLSAEEGGLPRGMQTLCMLGPKEPGFWPYFTSQPEFADGRPNPMNRWSERAIGELGQRFGGVALFPFGGPPYHPFYSWALRTGRCWKSPVQLLVSDVAGLFISFRGAIALPHKLSLPAVPASSPCDSCADKPCMTSCPVNAIGPRHYDVPACREFVGGPLGRDCLESGCAIRRSCPAGRNYPRLPEQSAFHQRAFLGGLPP